MSVLVVIAISLLVTHIAAVALTLTGLSQEIARFQARSAFTGVGFTTIESEKVVNHPVRRRIVTLLMILGNAGIVTVVSSLVLTFVAVAGSEEWLVRLGLLIIGLAILWIIGTNEWVDQHLSRLIGLILRRWSRLEVRDYIHLLHLADNYQVVELQVEEGDWLAEKTLAESDLKQEGILVLGIQRANGNYVGAPNGQTRIRPNDTLVLYGRASLLAELDYRPANRIGDQAHRQAIAEQQHVIQEQARREQEQT